MNHKRLLFLLFLLLGYVLKSEGQVCPPNIDFEMGDFSNWNCYTGTCCPIVTPTLVAPILGRHTITSGLGLDPYSASTIVYPGSGGSFSCKIGNIVPGGSKATSVQYHVHIPVGVTDNSFAFHYAVVLENPPTHTAANEPRFEVKAIDSATGLAVACDSYYVVTSQPGFVMLSGDRYFKGWTYANLKLHNLGGHTIIIVFSVSDCMTSPTHTVSHFGYAYIDVDCGYESLAFSDPPECPEVNAGMRAPADYLTWRWVDSSDFSTTLATTQNNVVPVPTVATTYAVIETAPPGYGCDDTSYTTVLPGRPEYVHLSHDTSICFGNTISLTGGVLSYYPPLVYSWTSLASVGCSSCDPVMVAPPIGTTVYSVSVTDRKGCEVDTFVTVLAYPSPGVFTGNNAVCVGLTTSLSNSVGGGIWSSSTPTVATVGSTTGVVRGFLPGTSVITYSFGSGLCIATTTITVNALPTNFLGTAGTCIGGTSTLSNSAGSGTWTSSNTIVATIGSLSGVLSGLSPGTSSITFVSSLTHCAASITVSVIPTPAPAITSTHVSCTTIGFTSAGSGPTYFWQFGDGGTGAGNPINHSYALSGLHIVTLTETDVFGCFATDTVHVHTFDPPLVNIGNDTIICVAGTPLTLASIYSYTSPTYLWSTGAATATITVTTSGTYWLRVTDGFCPVTDTIHVFYNPFPSVFLGNDTGFCIGSSTILTSAQPAGTTYLWNTGSTASAIAVSSSGTYWLQVNNGCLNSDTIHITVSPPQPVDLGPDTVNCTGSPVTLQSVYTYPPGTTYLWNTAATTPSITTAISGLYWLQVTTAWCAAADTTNVGVIFDTLNLLNVDTAICIGKTVQALANANPLASFQWVPTAGIALSTTSSPLITPDTSAMYYLNVLIPGCPAVRDSFYIEVQPYPKVYIGGNRAVCEFDTLHITASVSPTWFSNYHYAWYPKTFVDDSTFKTIVFTAGDTTSLKVIVSTSGGCKGIDSALFIVHPGNFASLIGTADICPRDSVQLLPVIVPGTKATFVWSPINYVSDPYSSQPWVFPVANQKYTGVATSQYGCKDTVSVRVVVHPAGVIFVGDSTIIFPGESYQISPQTNCTSFSWFPPQGLDNAYISNPIAMPNVNTCYIVHAATEWGCPAADSINIYVSYESLLGLPNAFVPGNGKNAKFTIVKRGLADLNYFRIFDRWGLKIFETKRIDEGWDGTYNGVPQPFGVYVYEVEAITSAGSLFKKHGNVTLIR